MKIDVLTIFPEMFEGVFGTSIIGRAVGTGKVEIKVHNLRDWSTDNYKSVDGHPFGGGAGMVMRVDVVERAVKELKESRTQEIEIGKEKDNKTVVVLMDTKGEMYNQKNAEELSKIEHIILIAPHFEGIDHRVHENIADKVFCVGPYVLSGGELPVMTVVDSVVRLIPGALGNPESLTEESFNTDIEREYPQYTRPAEYNGWKVPEVLLSGNHAEIEKWRKGR